MKNAMLVLFVTLFTFGLSAQDTLMLEKEPMKKMENRKGPNSSRFSHLYYGVKFPIPIGTEGSEILFWNSYGMEFGHRSKLRVSNFYSLGFDVAYAFNRYRMKQVDGKITPDAVLYDKQSIRNNEWRLGFYNRFNLDLKRGNVMGKYIDLGVYGTYHFGNKTWTEVEADNVTVTTVTRKLDYIEPWGYGVYAHLGAGAFILKFEYRLSPYFKEDTVFPDLSPYTIGMQVGLHD
jgi:hypothetical protein